MRPFGYVRAESPEAAAALVAGDLSAAFVGGGTEILNWLKDGLADPALLVDVGRLGLDAVEVSDGGLRLGSGARMSDVARDRHVRAEFPVLARALEAGASPQLRNMATLGGNLLQRTRCAYFREPSFPCNKRVPGTGCPARDGDHAMHAILGASDACVAVHPSDLAVALLALDARVEVLGVHGRREVAIEDFYPHAGDDPRRETALRHGELVVGIGVPSGPRARTSGYLKVRERGSFAFALVSVAAAVEVVEGVVRSARIALGGVAHRPWRVRAAEDALLGRPLADGSVADAAEAAVRDADPLPGNRYKVAIARGAVRRVLEEIGERG
ncbi:FAD binding domain-containing protein [Umezawaea tangerina]|uniref:Xanthine dehydrogenase YagS FAD-binding subunit n=1 Tax=Umezawaea tangerina TaxID=84725 RepID=A0A2T0T1N5_9PSEU|nr:FAD binding domain-containing protein [Umezawaea tangerina]PRY39561.1 xanthine dehydrogenase YagS FAD-binding subunit [Umezawaea tangerina]